jgi:hypothetical protein
MQNKTTHTRLLFEFYWNILSELKKYSRGAGGKIFVIYGQPMESNVIISEVLLRCRILYLYTENCPDLNKGRYLKPSKSRTISFDGRLYFEVWKPLAKRSISQ